jgi:16S rRNA (cytosine967-C5)-methyltransferase
MKRPSGGKNGKRPSRHSPRAKAKDTRADPSRVAAIKAFLDFEGGATPRNPPAALVDESERRLYTRLVAGLLRHKRLLEAEVLRLNRGPAGRLDRVAVAIAMLGLLQLREMEIAPHAVLYETVEVAARLGYARAKGWINAVLRSALRERDSGAPGAEYPLAVRTSHPDWMVERWRARYGEARCTEICEANNEFAGLAVRVEHGRAERDAVSAALQAEGVGAEPHPLLGEALVSGQIGAVVRSAAFREGKLFVQDAASQLLTAWTAPLWRGRLLDACAAPGGKLTHLLRLAEPGLRVVATERERSRFRLIRDNLTRLQLPARSFVIADAARPPFPPGSFDTVLLDVPCLSTGIIRKYPEIKWRKRLDDLTALTAAQAAMLDAAAALLRPGGRILYSTCSLEPEENEQQVAAFLARHSGFARGSFAELPVPAGFTGSTDHVLSEAGDFQALPGPHWMGLYAALLERRAQGSLAGE